MKFSIRYLLPNRRWFQFSLKMMLIVITLLCVGPGGYVAYEQKKCREQKAAVEALLKIGDVSYYEKVKPRSAAMRAVLGDESFGYASRVCFNKVKDYDHKFNDADLRHLKSLPHLKYLGLKRCKHITAAGLESLFELPSLLFVELDGTCITDTSLARITGLTRFKGVTASDTKLTDAGVFHLAGLNNLELVDLTNTQVTDAGMVHLAGLTKLKILNLNGTSVTDVGLKHLTGLTNLDYLDLRNTAVTIPGVNELKDSVPKCTFLVQ